MPRTTEVDALATPCFRHRSEPPRFDDLAQRDQQVEQEGLVAATGTPVQVSIGQKHLAVGLDPHRGDSSNIYAEHMLAEMEQGAPTVDDNEGCQSRRSDPAEIHATERQEGGWSADK